VRIFKPDSIEYLNRVLDTTVANLPKTASAVTLRNLYRNFYRVRDATLLVDAKDYTVQFVSAWLILRYMHSAGYNNVYEQIFENFDKEVQQSSLGIYLKNRLTEGRKFSVGSSFPAIKLLDVNLKPKVLTFNRPESNGHTYTLIDFWYSSCGPCIAQFSEVKALRRKYSNNTLKVVGISIDNKDKVPAWRGVIRSKQLTWLQYLDLGAANAKQMGINSYPSNFLIDGNGKIIARNLEIEEIDKLLAD
jgi:thiol-disulfide isomerase/thioredoxin